MNDVKLYHIINNIEFSDVKNKLRIIYRNFQYLDREISIAEINRRYVENS